MKTKILFFLSFIFATSFMTAQDNCEIYYPMKEGVKFQISHYDGSKKKPSSIVNCQITNVKKTGEGISSTLKMSIEGEEGNIPDQEIDVFCNGNKLSIDYESLLNPEMLAQYGDFDYEISGTSIDWPSNLSVGQTLPDAEMNMNISVSGMNMNIKTTISNRKVIAKEKITTPAGTFDCYVMTYDTTVDAMGMNSKTSTKEWFSKGVGMIKQEGYRNGKVQNWSQLTAFSK